MSVASWSTDPAENTSIDGVNIAEGCPPGNMNDMGRRIMASVREFYDDASDAPDYPLSIANGGTGEPTPAAGLAALGGAGLVRGQITRSTSFTFAESDSGKLTYWVGGAGICVLPANATRSIAVGAAFTIINNGSGSLEIRTGDGPPPAVLKLSPGGGTGYRTLAVGGTAIVSKVATDLWFVSGWGVS